MNHPQRVLITGHKGYIGSVLTPIFVRAGHEVVGLDTGYFADCTLIPDPIEVPALQKDIRNVEPADLRGFDAIVHLAALSNDPIGNLNDAWTGEINHQASVRLAEMGRAAGVKRLLFSSSCIMYGMSELSEVNEDCPLHPQTEYARSKVAAEHDIREIAADGFSPVYLRNGTIYGISPRMRFDTVFNDFMAAAVCTGKIMVHSDGTPWRPVIHVEDVARAFLRVLEAKAEQIHNRAFNIGANDLNYQVGALAAIAAESVAGCTLSVTANPGADQRTYRCDFNRFADTFPDFAFQWNARKAAPVMRDTLRTLGVTTAVWKDPRFTRLLWLRQLMQGHHVDDNLRWTAEAGVAAAAR